MHQIISCWGILWFCYLTLYLQLIWSDWCKHSWNVTDKPVLQCCHLCERLQTLLWFRHQLSDTKHQLIAASTFLYPLTVAVSKVFTSKTRENIFSILLWIVSRVKTRAVSSQEFVHRKNIVRTAGLCYKDVRIFWNEMFQNVSRPYVSWIWHRSHKI